MYPLYQKLCSCIAWKYRWISAIPALHRPHLPIAVPPTSALPNALNSKSPWIRIEMTAALYTQETSRCRALQHADAKSSSQCSDYIIHTTYSRSISKHAHIKPVQSLPLNKLVPLGIRGRLCSHWISFYPPEMQI